MPVAEPDDTRNGITETPAAEVGQSTALIKQELTKASADMADLLTHILETAQPEISISPEEANITMSFPTQGLSGKQPLTEKRRRQLRALLILVSLAVFLTSLLLFWQNVTATHLYVSTLNPSNGETLAREDIGSGYTQDAIIAPTMGQSPVFFGIAGGQPASPVQQVVELQKSGTSWQQTNRFSAPLTHGTLSVTQHGNLVIESNREVEVTTPRGQVLWHMTGDQPELGAHAFRPAFDSSTLYTVEAAATGQVAAYDLQNGIPRWTTGLKDTLNYAAPLLLDGTTLYVAGDHAIFALNSRDGTLLWTTPHATRTLLLSGSGAHQLLIAASADGLLALHAGDGSPVWTFHGQQGKMTPAGVLSLTPTQFYQASAAATTIFATGIAWKAPEIQEELWLYALDATTGNVRWSRQVGAGMVSADAGRVFIPLADSAQHLVILEQQLDSSTLTIVAFDASSGEPRWQSQFQGISAASPSLLTPSNNVLLFISMQADSGTALRIVTIAHLELQATMLLSILGLLLLLLFPWQIQKQRYQQALNRLAHEQLTPAWQAARSKRYSRKLPTLALLVVLIATGVAGYTQLNKAQESVSLLDIHTGVTHWQHISPLSTGVLAANEQGGILSVTEEANMHRVLAVDTNGNTLWQTFASEGTFSVPAVPTQQGTILLALSGHTPLHYSFAPDDPAYPHPLDSLLILSLLNRNTGQPLWQSAIINPGDQQSGTVLGADAHFIYVASSQTNPPASSGGAAIQLLAVDQTSGLVAWRVFGPVEPFNTPRDNGTLLLQGRQILWQVEGAVYAIDSVMGQIAWRRSLGNDD
jgi:outer membrane protein assembly factor BamB